MSAVPLRRGRRGSAMNDTTRELGGALGVAVLGSLVRRPTRTRSAVPSPGLSGADRAAAESGLTGALGVGQRLGAGGADLIQAAKQAFVDGLSLAAIGGAVAVAVAAVAAWRLLPARPSCPAPASAGVTRRRRARAGARLRLITSASA